MINFYEEDTFIYNKLTIYLKIFFFPVSWIVPLCAECRIVYEIFECLKRCMINEVACYLYAYHVP